MAVTTTSQPADDQPERTGSDAPTTQAVTTQGGDYAEGNIDKRRGAFVAGDQYDLNGDFRDATVYTGATIVQPSREPPPPAFQVPYRPIPLIGRDEALAELTTLLTGEAPVVLAPAIAGMGGVGKTMLAATFAHQHQAAFPGGIFWLNMEQPDLIAGQVAACAGPGGLDLADFAALSFDERIARVQAAWNSPVRRLLVLDNLEDPALLTRWQPTGSGARVLITTRRDDWPRQVQRLRLAVLQRPRSIELLLGARADDQGIPVENLLVDAAERIAADAICDLLGDLPLALAIAAALLRLHSSLRLEAFHAQIVADPLFTAPTALPTMQAVLGEAGLPTGRERGVAATFAISYQHLKPDDEGDAQALRMVHAAAYCAPSAIPQEPLWQVAGRDPTNADDQQAGDAITRRLRALGLIDVASSDNAGAITLHRLLAAFVRQQPHAQELLGATARALTSYTHALQAAGQIKRSRDLVPHLEAILVHQSALQGSDRPDTLGTAHNLALTLYRQGDYAAARERYETVLNARTRLLGPEHPTTLGTAHNLAITLSSQGDYAAARERYETVLNALTRLLGPEHPDTLTTAMGLANTLLSQGDYAAARERYETVLAAQTRLLGPEHPDTLSTANNLANTLECLGRWRVAARLRMQIVASSERQLGSAHPDAIKYLTALSRNLGARGYQRRARQLLKTRLRELPEGIWRNVVQSLLFFARARAVLTALLLGWLASGLVASTGGGWLLSAAIVLSAVLSYWSRWALIVLFALAGAALAAPFSSGLPTPWSWICLALAGLFAGGVVPYGAPVIARLLSVTRMRLLFRPIQRWNRQLGQRSLAWLQTSDE